ncbi:MAG: hypothetical protein ACTH7O_09330, partial [Microbacterium gubbeenense]
RHAAGSSTDDYTPIREEPFIPDKFVSMDFATTWGCGQAFKKDRMFGGDNRSYTMPTRSAPYDGVSSKTSVALNINWENSAPYKIQWVKEVGTTRLYENYKLIDSATASSDGIKIIDVSTTSAYAQARIDHKVANPYCIAGAITYNVMFRWYRNGTFEVVGWRRPVPNHEVYGGWDNGKGLINWHTLGKYGNLGFHCLTGACGTRDMNISQRY